MFDHAPCRQSGQFVIIGRTEQVVFQRLLLGDIGGAREQQIALGDPDRPVRSEKHLSGLAAGEGFFQNRRAAGAEQFKTGLAAIGLLRRRRRGRGHLEQRRRGIVRQQELTTFVPNRHAVWKQPEDIPQDAQFGIEGAFITGLRRGRLKVMFIGTMHGRRAWQSLL